MEHDQNQLPPEDVESLRTLLRALRTAQGLSPDGSPPRASSMSDYLNIILNDWERTILDAVSQEDALQALTRHRLKAQLISVVGWTKAREHGPITEEQLTELKKLKEQEQLRSLVHTCSLCGLSGHFEFQCKSPKVPKKTTSKSGGRKKSASAKKGTSSPKADEE